MRTVWRLAEQPVLATDDERSDGVFCRVVVQRDAAIVEEPDQLGPLVIQVVQRFPDRGFRRHLRQGFRQPLFQLLKQGPTLFSRSACRASVLRGLACFSTV